MKNINFKRVVGFGLIVILIILLVSIASAIRTESEKKEKALVNDYITCLERNQMQRYYCGEKLGRTYQWLDSLLKKHGYRYEKVNYDLYIVEDQK